MKNILAVLFLLSLTACATVGVQTKEVLRSPPNIPPKAEIKNVPFIKQTENYCGPSTLAMTMQWAGRPVSADLLAPEVYTSQKQGTLQMDMIVAGRRHGLLAVPIEGLANLLKEIAAGHPVIVLENLGFSWIPEWHYAVAVGYDLKEQELILHSGEKAFEHLSLNYFERQWKLADYWGLVILPPTELSVTADELEHLKGAVGLEQGGFNKEAEQVYRSILTRWPESLGAYIGLGNLAYSKKDYLSAVDYLKQATKFHPESTAAQHNLQVAKNALK